MMDDIELKGNSDIISFISTDTATNGSGVVATNYPSDSKRNNIQEIGLDRPQEKILIDELHKLIDKFRGKMTHAETLGCLDIVKHELLIEKYED